MNSKKKHILISLVGRTPQILTESLYALMVGLKIPLSEIWVLTTEEGQQTILTHLLNANSGKFHQFCHDWQIDPSKIKFDAENILMAQDFNNVVSNVEKCEPLVNLMLKLIKRLTQDSSNILHCSLAGGRKTMSVYFAFALQFFGRQQDKLYHLLTQPPEFQNHPEFYYIPPQPKMLEIGNGKQLSTEQATIELVEVPYVRLRNKMEYLFGNRDLSFEEMVRITQSELEQMPDLLPLVVDVQRKQLIIGDKKVLLSPIEMAFYRYYAERSKVRRVDIPVKEYERYFEKAEGEWFPNRSLEKVLLYYRELISAMAVERFLQTLEKGYFSFNRACQYFSRIKRKIQSSMGDDELAEYYIISAVGRYRKCYGIKLDRSKIVIVT